MDAQAKTLRFLGEPPQKLTVPFFQRHYVWDENNWEELLNSFENPQTKPFLGSIILKKSERSLTTSEATIIDGQQRLTTITILAKALYDCLPKSEKGTGSGIEHDIKSFLFYKQNAADNFKKGQIKLEHSRLDKPDYEKVIATGLLDDCTIDLDTITEKSSKILNCYKYYRTILKNKDLDYVFNLHNSMFGENRRVFVLIELDYEDINEQAIFDTINRAGVKLSVADIIKNNLFKRCLDTCIDANKTPDEVCKLHDDKWLSIFYLNNEEKSVWDEERVFGNVKRTTLEFLLWCVACIEWGKKSDSFSELDKVFADSIVTYDYWQLEVLVNKIFDYGVLFKKFVLDLHNSIRDKETTHYFIYAKPIERLMMVLEQLKVQMFYPYVIKRLKDVNGNYNDPELLHDFHILESFVMRRRLSPKGVNDYSDKCDSILKSEKGIKLLVENDLANAESVLRDIDIKRYLSYVTNDTAKLILFYIELHYRSDPRFDENALPYELTLEHVMPIAWENCWDAVEVYDENGNIIEKTDSNRVEIRKVHLQNIGNMILLNGKLNRSLSNKSFDDKMRLGYKILSSLIITRKIINEFDAGKTTWDETRIRKRQEDIWKVFVQLWPRFAEEVTKDSVNKEVRTDEDIRALDKISQEAFDDPIKMLEEV